MVILLTLKKLRRVVILIDSYFVNFKQVSLLAYNKSYINKNNNKNNINDNNNNTNYYYYYYHYYYKDNNTNNNNHSGGKTIKQ